MNKKDIMAIAMQVAAILKGNTQEKAKPSRKARFETTAEAGTPVKMGVIKVWPDEVLSEGTTFSKKNGNGTMCHYTMTKDGIPSPKAKNYTVKRWIEKA
jgi:hypothetical protein